MNPATLTHLNYEWCSPSIAIVWIDENKNKQTKECDIVAFVNKDAYYDAIKVMAVSAQGVVSRRMWCYAETLTGTHRPVKHILRTQADPTIKL